MTFEMTLKNGGCTSENSSSSLIDEVTDHLKNTWSHVLSGKASTQEYAEAALEASLAVAATGFVLKKGFDFLSNRGFLAEIGLGGRGVERAGLANAYTDPKLLEIRRAAHGDFVSKVKEIPLGKDGLPFSITPPAKSKTIADAIRSGASPGVGSALSQLKFIEPVRIPRS
ncbi:MAG TPA: hypothetical protein PKZ32_22125 [Candidatus Melainabacteria bacterium]|nr:hypothetical protein [Candidatus Melainabacteria bacterium]